MYDAVELKPQAHTFIEGQSKKVQRQLVRRIEGLQRDSRPPTSKLLDAGKNIYRVRSGNYRIIHQIEDKKLLVIVARVGDRRDVYNNLTYLAKEH